MCATTPGSRQRGIKPPTLSQSTTQSPLDREAVAHGLHPMSSTSLWLLVVRQSVPLRLEAAQDDWPLPHRQLETHRRSLVPQKRSSRSEGSAHQTSWHHCRHPPNLPAIPISATRGLAIDNGEVSWTRSSCLVHVLHSSQRHQGRSHRDDLEPSSLSSHRHRATIRALQSAGTVDV